MTPAGPRNDAPSLPFRQHELARQQDASALREALELIRDDPFTNHGPASKVQQMRWIARQALAALPPSASAGLDVERLERALFGVRFNPLRDSSMEWAERIAAEYAHLEQDHP